MFHSVHNWRCGESLFLWHIQVRRELNHCYRQMFLPGINVLFARLVALFVLRIGTEGKIIEVLMIFTSCSSLELFLFSALPCFWRRLLPLASGQVGRSLSVSLFTALRHSMSLCWGSDNFVNVVVWFLYVARATILFKDPTACCWIVISTSLPSAFASLATAATAPGTATGHDPSTITFSMSLARVPSLMPASIGISRFILTFSTTIL